MDSVIIPREIFDKLIQTDMRYSTRKILDIILREAIGHGGYKEVYLNWREMITETGLSEASCRNAILWLISCKIIYRRTPIGEKPRYRLNPIKTWRIPKRKEYISPEHIINSIFRKEK